MVENTKIEWAHHTLNPWVGCSKVSVGPLGACVNCYAESWAKRAGRDVWGDRPRQRTTAAHWAQALKWNRAAQLAGVRYRVFCASLADVFDNQVDPAWRLDLFRLIAETPNLDWLLLTKRIGNARQMLDEVAHRAWPAREWGEWAPMENVWLGSTVVTQEEAERDIPKLLAVPAAIRFLSIEPMMGPIDLSFIDHLDHTPPWPEWIICGGESGHHARPLHIAWAEDLRAQCAGAGVAFFFKQGSQANWPHFKDFASFPESLQIREFPQ